MLAYVFWHWPDPSVDRARYAEALVAFHRALAWRLPAGMRASRVYEIEGAPWVPVPRAFEDWYLVDDFTALGVLNDAAVLRGIEGLALVPREEPQEEPEELREEDANLRY